MTKTYYRITYENDEGIYNALKNRIPLNEWKRLLMTSNMNWLKKPRYYSDKNKSYFTKKGFIMFMKKTYPLILKYLDSEKIDIHRCVIDESNIVYRDLYQVITE